MLESRSPRPGRFHDSSKGLWPGDLDFLTLSTNNERTERKSWRVNFFLFVSFCFVFVFVFFFQFNSILYFTLNKIFTQVYVGRKIK